MNINYEKDYYKILEIEKLVDHKEIKEAYHRLSLKYHPDKNDASLKDEFEKKFNEIAEAYSVLKDKEARIDYDQNYIEVSVAMFISVVSRNASTSDIDQYLQNGANINISNKYKQTILMYAANRGKVEILQFLLQNNASISEIDELGNTALLYAAAEYSFYFDVPDVSFEKTSSKFDSEEDKLEHQKAMEELEQEQVSSAKRIQDLLKEIFGMPKDIKPGTIVQDKAEAIKLLLENGSNINQANKLGDKAINMAQRNKYQPIIDLLLNYVVSEDMMDLSGVDEILV
ncbi:MAG: DnaJ domain-containing protein [Pseudomonadota bacterium]